LKKLCTTFIIMTVSKFENVLQSCLSPDNATRQQAEKFLTDSITQNPQHGLSLLAGTLCSQDETVRSMAAVLIRKKIVTNETKFKAVDDNSKKELMTLVIKQLELEKSDQARKKLGDLIVELAVVYEGRWTDLTKTLLLLVNKPNPSQETALYILGELAAGMKMNKNDLESFLSLAGQNFLNTKREVQMEALMMFGKCICVMKGEDLGKYRTVVPTIMQVLMTLLQNGDETNAQKLLQVLIEIAASNATFYIQQINDLGKICLALSTEETFEPGTKTLGLEILCTILENEPQMVRKNKEFIDITIRICFNLMLVIETDSDWDKTYCESVEDDETFDAGQVGLNRLSENINAKKFLPILMPKLKDLMNGADWRMRHAAFVAMAQCCELFHENKQNKNQIFESIVNGMKDSHYRVRFAAIHCLGIMCSDFGKKFVNKYSSNILDIFEAGMSDIQHPRIQAGSAICVVNYAEKVAPKLLRPRLENLLQKLFSLLNQPQKFVKENALSAVSECAENSKDQFLKYYKDLTPHVMRILKEAVDKEYISLRLEALRCLSQIGVAVGAKTFSNDAVLAMQISLPIIKQDGVEVVSILSSWNQIFQTCTDSMAPFINQIAEVAFKYASQSVKLLDWDSDDEDVELNAREEPVNASSVEEKVAALNLLFAIINYSNGHATPIVKPAADILIPLIDDPVDDSIQEAAAEALPGLVVCLCSAIKNRLCNVTNEDVKCFFNTVLSKVAKRMPLEESPGSLCSFSICIEKCISTNKELTLTLPEPMLKQLYAALLTCLKESAERMDARNHLMKEDDQDDEDKEKLIEQNEQEATVSTNISDAVGALVKVYGDNFIPILQTEYDTLNGLLSDDSLDIQKRAALYIFCDVVEHCSTRVLENQLHFFVGHFKKAASNIEDVCVRQVGIFALGLLFEKTKGAVCSALPANDILKLCFAQFTDPRYLTQEDVEDVQDNAALTIGRVCKFCPNQVDCSKVYPEWLNCFPIRNDDDCSQWCYTEMIRLIAASNVALIGEGGSNIAKIVHWIAEVAYTDMSNKCLDQSLADLINKVKSEHSLMSAIKAELPIFLMEKLQRHL